MDLHLNKKVTRSCFGQTRWEDHWTFPSKSNEKRFSKHVGMAIGVSSEQKNNEKLFWSNTLGGPLDFPGQSNEKRFSKHVGRIICSETM